VSCKTGVRPLNLTYIRSTEQKLDFALPINSMFSSGSES